MPMETNQHPSNLFQTCEKEPIHIPGAIQPFGVLLNVEPLHWIIRNASVNCQAWFGIPAAGLVGRSFAEFIDAAQLQDLQQYLAQDNVRDRTPFLVRLETPAPGGFQHCELMAHTHHDCLIIELEPYKETGVDALVFHRKIRESVQALQATGTVQQMCDEAVRRVQEITGFDRVMLYQFTEDWHGMVIAEVRAPHMDSFLGHHFPASDIPAQARAVFLQNWLRTIPDVDYTPAGLYPGTDPHTGAPLDLGKSMLRSVSPIHIEYLRNMHVGATLTVSLIDDGKLWGLIACHHATPRLLDSDSRLGAKMIGQLVSAQLQLKQSLEDLHYRARLRQVHQRLLSYMEQEEDLVRGLVNYTPNMLDLAAADGAAAAVYHDNKWTIIGRTPSVAQIEELVTWLSSHHAGQSLFCTNRLGSHFPPAKAYKDVASGLLAISIPKSERNYILWFRPEVATTVTWAGNPEKAVVQEGGQVRLHPRASFRSWQEVVEGVAVQWRKVEVEAVAELRACILALDLQREFRKERLARANAERMSREMENMVHIVTHDLRTPLAVVRMSLELMQHAADGDPAISEALLHRSLRATEAIERLASDVLDMAKSDADTWILKPRAEKAEQLVQEAVDMAQPLAGKKTVQLHVRLEAPHACVLCERARIERVFGNLIGNALKFTPAGGDITVSVQPDGEMLVFCVSDTGIGIAPGHLTKIFDRFYQEEHARQQGTGLGLAIAKTIVEKHGGRIWAESTPGSGSRFFFTLPSCEGERQG